MVGIHLPFEIGISHRIRRRQRPCRLNAASPSHGSFHGCGSSAFTLWVALIKANHHVASRSDTGAWRSSAMCSQSGGSRCDSSVAEVCEKGEGSGGGRRSSRWRGDTLRMHQTAIPNSSEAIPRVRKVAAARRRPRAGYIIFEATAVAGTMMDATAPAWLQPARVHRSGSLATMQIRSVKTHTAPFRSRELLRGRNRFAAAFTGCVSAIIQLSQPTSVYLCRVVRNK